MKEIIEEFQLNTSHFTLGGRNKKIGVHQTPTEDYLTNKVKVTTHRLRLRLITDGYFEEKCNNCGNTEWLSEKIPLELHHKDGNKDNNLLEKFRTSFAQTAMFLLTLTKQKELESEHRAPR